MPQPLFGPAQLKTMGFVNRSSFYDNFDVYVDGKSSFLIIPNTESSRASIVAKVSSTHGMFNRNVSSFTVPRNMTLRLHAVVNGKTSQSHVTEIKGGSKAGNYILAAKDSMCTRPGAEKDVMANALAYSEKMLGEELLKVHEDNPLYAESGDAGMFAARRRATERLAERNLEPPIIFFVTQLLFDSSICLERAVKACQLAGATTVDCIMAK